MSNSRRPHYPGLGRRNQLVATIRRGFLGTSRLKALTDPVTGVRLERWPKTEFRPTRRTARQAGRPADGQQARHG